MSNCSYKDIYNLAKRFKINISQIDFPLYILLTSLIYISQMYIITLLYIYIYNKVIIISL